MINRNYGSIRLEVTSKCNINCLYCHNSEYANKEDDMDSDTIIKLIQDIKKIHPIRKILLTGGEPLLNPNIKEIVSTISSLNIKPDLVTNGKMLNNKLANELIEAGLKRIRLSIDGFEEHSEYRKGSSAERLWELAEQLVNRNDVNVCVHTVCSPHNVETLYEVYKKLVEIGVHRWRVFDIGYQGGVIQNRKSMSFKEYYNNFFEKTKEIVKNYVENNYINKIDIEISNLFKTEILKLTLDDYIDTNIDEMLEERLLDSPCDYVAHQMTIRSNGQVTLCQYFHNTIYDLPKHGFSLVEAFNDQIPVIENDIQLQKIESCSKCMYVQLCSSGCRARAEVLTGNILGADPVRCFMMPVMVKDIVPILPFETQEVINQFINNNGEKPHYTQEDLEYFLQDGGFLF